VLYSIEVSIPANTPRETPLQTLLPVTSGMVKRVWVRWRWGSANLCGCRILRWGSQMWPRTLNQWFPSSTHDTTFEEAYLVQAEPLEFVVEGYNLDDTYPHKVWVAVLVLQPEVSQNIARFLEYLSAGG